MQSQPHPYSLCSVLNVFDFEDVKGFPESFYCSPYFFSYLHLSAILNPAKIKNPDLAYSKFKVPFMLDIFDKTPLHYILARRPIDYLLVNTLFEYILDYLEDTEQRNLIEVSAIMKSLTPMFSTIVTKINPKLRDRYLTLCCQTPDFAYMLPQFGDTQLRYTFAITPYITTEAVSEIYKDGQDQVAFTATMPYLDYEPTSDDMLGITLTLSTIKSEEVFKSPFVEKLIAHLWKKTLSATLIYGALYSIYMLLFSIYIGLGQSILAYEIILLCLTLLVLCAEFMQIWVLKSVYLNDVWNMADLFQSLLVIVFMALRINHSCNHSSSEVTDPNSTLAEQWISSIAILSGYLRWISYLQIFKSTSTTIFYLPLLTYTH